MTVHIAGTFKKDQRENNGLEAIAKELITDPLTRHHVVGIVETKRITKDIADGGTETVTVRFVQLEVALDDDTADVQLLIDRAWRVRTNRDDFPQDTLPFGTAETVADGAPWPGDVDYADDDEQAPAARSEALPAELRTVRGASL